jgi:hypothetical protein
MRWVVHVGCMGETEGVHTGFLWIKLGERNNFEDLGLDRIIILKWLFKKREGP